MSVRTLVATGLALTVIAGCGGTTSGTPVTATEVVGTQSQAPVETARPRSFDLGAVDPCTLMPENRRAEFGLDQPNQPPDPEIDPEGVRRCSVPSSAAASFSVFLDSNGPSSTRLAQVAPDGIIRTIVVNEFEVVLIEGGDNQSCLALVDTGDTANLVIQANGTGRLTVEQTCDAVEPWVQVVLDTLAQQQPE